MLENLYDFFGILVCLVVVFYEILLVTLTSFKMNKIKKVTILQNVTFLAMLTIVILIIANFILTLMLEKIMIFDIILYIVACISDIALYFFVKNIEKIVNKLL